MTRSPKPPKNKHLVCLPGGNHPSRKDLGSLIPKPSENNMISPSPSNSEEFTRNLQQLEEKAIQINQLVAELETAIAELKEIGDRVDLSSIYFRKNLGHRWFPDRICKYGEVKVPRIRQTGYGVLVLSSRCLQLTNIQHSHREKEAQQEANLLADLLRKRNKAINNHP